MKDIKDMNLEELADALEFDNPSYNLNERSADRLRELHAEHDGRMSALMAKCSDAEMALRVLRAEHEALKEQTRWIPVSERLPTEADADENDDVLVRLGGGTCETMSWSSVHLKDWMVKRTHWKRITPPKDKL